MKFLPVFLVATFGFLVASFPARNADLWKHLAAGRELATDFSLPTVEGQEESFPHHRGWLYDLLTYLIYSAAGGAGMVLAKTLAIAGCALAMYRLSRTGAGSLTAAAFTFLALLTMSGRLLLQPATISCLFFVLALWFLFKETANQDSAGGVQREVFSVFPPWRLVLLFVIWANMDSWFLLGLATLGLAWLGKAVDGRFNAVSTNYRGSFSVGILAAACLLNPLHVRAFTLGPELWTVYPPLGYSSPFQSAYLLSVGRTPAGLAYYFLLGLGAISFVLNLPDWPWRKFLPWLGLAIFSSAQVTAMPFFAILSAPMLSRNFGDWKKRRETLDSTLGISRSPNRLLPLFGLCLGIVMIFCAWPGWLQSPPYEPRRWAIETGPAFEQGETLSKLRQLEEKLGPENRGLHLSPESAFAFSWYFHESAPLASTVLGYPKIASDWEERLRNARINHIVVFDPGSGRHLGALAKFLKDPHVWPLLFQEGNLAVFGWRDPANAKSKDLFRGLEIDLNQLAFHPVDDKKAPRNRPERELAAPRWYDSLWKAQPPRPPDVDEAALHLLHAELLGSNAPQRNLLSWESSKIAGLVAAAAAWTVPDGLINAHQRLVFFRPLLPAPGAGINTVPAFDQWALRSQKMYSLEKDDMPPALLYLAIRAARRALGANPADAQAHLVLGESYLYLLRNTRERVWGARLKHLTQLRRVLASAALNQAILLQPNLAKAHRLLGGLYSDMGYLDLALKHFQAHRKLVPLRGRAQQIQDQVGHYDLELSRLAEAVQEREKKFGTMAGGMRVLDRAMLANQLGLAGKARDLLLESDVTAFGRFGMALELDLLLKTGRIKEVREWTGEDQKDMLGEIPFYWIRAQALAASGDYSLSERELATLAIAWQGPVEPRTRMVLEIAKTVLEEQPLTRGNWAYQVWRAPGRIDFRDRVLGLARRLRGETNAIVLRGLLALEEGEVDNARIAFRRALALWKDEASVASGAGLDFDARPIAQECLRWWD